MNLRTRKLIASATWLVTLTATAFGEQGVIRREEAPTQGRQVERSSVNFAGPWRPPNSNGLTRVVGTVIDIRQVIVPKVKVQLRNLNTGLVEQHSESNENGQYAFELEESGTYVVEMVMVDGAVVALSNAGSLSRYETMNTVVQLPGRWDAVSGVLVPVQSVTSFLGLSSTKSLTSTTIDIATDQNVRPQDPGIELSPKKTS